MINEVISARVNVEQNHRLGGNQVKNKGEKHYDYLDGKLEVEGKEEEVNAEAFVSPLAYKYPIRLDEKVVKVEHVQHLDPMLRMTKGMYMIKYTPIHSYDYKRGRPFKIGQDLIRWDIRVSGVKEWVKLCERIPELGWLRRNSTLDDDMFRLAKLHPGMSFWFTVKWLEYEAKIQKNEIDAGREPVEKPFVSHKTSTQEYVEAYRKNDKQVLCRVLGDVLKDVQDVEMSHAVQKEMLENTGETFILREQYIPGHGGVKQPQDPKTGRFISKKQKQEKEEE